MASPREQRRRMNRAQEYGQTVFERELGSWTANAVAEWTPGTTRVPDETETELNVILTRSYDKIANRTLDADYRIYKQDEDEPQPFDESMTAIAIALAAVFGSRIGESLRAVLTTLSEMMRRSNDTANVEPDLTMAERNRIARADLRRRMRSHRLTIAVTESNWTVNTAHSTAIISVTDPLGNAVERIAQLFQQGDTAAARRLARRTLKLARLPSSVRQGELIRTVSDFRDRLVTPEAQARAVAAMRDQAQRLGQETKRWVTMGDERVRSSHAAAHGQERPKDEPFQLAGGLLMYPMDGSLGAPLSEIINCRCEAVWI